MKQLDLFGKNSQNIEIHKITNGEYFFIENFFDVKKSNFYLESFLKDIHWKQEKMNMYGKELPFPRLTAWYGDNDKPYKFSGITLRPEPWTNELLQIKQAIEKEATVNFNSVLLNLYRNGNDSISWHTDAEKALGENPVIASVSLGGTRKFQLKHIKTKEKIEIQLTHGSLLVMQGELQHFWKHQIPKTKKQVKKRINLTFRTIK